MASPDLLGSLKIPREKKIEGIFVLKLLLSEVYSFLLHNALCLTEKSLFPEWIQRLPGRFQLTLDPVASAACYWSQQVTWHLSHQEVELNCESCTTCFTFFSLWTSNSKKTANILLHNTLPTLLCVVTVLATPLDFHGLCFRHLPVVGFFHSPTLLKSSAKELNLGDSEEGHSMRQNIGCHLFSCMAGCNSKTQPPCICSARLVHHFALWGMRFGSVTLEFL